MNRYRLAAHFASRSCDGLVKRFGLSSPTLPADLLFLHLLLLYQHQHITNIRTAPRVTLFFSSHATALSRPAGVVKRINGVVGHSGFSKRKTSHEECVLARMFHRVEEGGEGSESRSDGRFYRVLLLVASTPRPILTTQSSEFQ